MYNFSKKQKIAIGIIFAILAIIVVSYVYSRGSEASTNDEILEENIMQEKDEDEIDSQSSSDEDQIIVHVAGAVNQEGIVYLKEGARINEAIEKAGGATEEADMSQVNLAYELEDGMKIYIPKKGEIMDENADQDYLVKFSTTTDGTSAGSTTATTSNTGTSASAGGSADNGSTAGSRTSSKTTSAKVNINKANQSELETLPGIGPSTAQKIIAHRQENGKFDSIDALKDVSGIGDAKYNSIKDLITVK